MTATDQDAGIAGLPVITDLLARYGPTFGGPHLAGTPAEIGRRSTGRVTRMVWVWFVGGNNYNLCADRRAGGWVIKASGPAGRLEFTLAGRRQPDDALIRGVVTAVGLLGDAPACERCDRPIRGTPVTSPGDPLGRRYCTEECADDAGAAWQEGHYRPG